MLAIANLVHQTSTSTGTGNFTLASVNGKKTFNTAFSTGGTDVFHYFISNRDAAEWEYGSGHMSDATTLVRDTVIESSNSNSAVSFSAGTKDLTNDLPAEHRVQGPNGVTGSTAAIAFASKTDLAAASAPSSSATAIVDGSSFVWDASDLSTEVTADTLEGIYVPPDSDATGASGAWVRVVTDHVSILWFGAVGTYGNSTDSTAAIQAALDWGDTLKLPTYAPPGYYNADQIEIPASGKFYGAGIRSYGLGGDDATVIMQPSGVGDDLVIFKSSGLSGGIERINSISIQDMVLIGPGSGTTGSAISFRKSGTRTDMANHVLMSGNCSLKNLIVRGFPEHGIYNYRGCAGQIVISEIDALFLGGYGLNWEGYSANVGTVIDTFYGEGCTGGAAIRLKMRTNHCSMALRNITSEYRDNSYFGDTSGFLSAGPYTVEIGDCGTDTVVNITGGSQHISNTDNDSPDAFVYVNTTADSAMPTINVVGVVGGSLSGSTGNDSLLYDARNGVRIPAGVHEYSYAPTTRVARAFSALTYLKNGLISLVTGADAGVQSLTADTNKSARWAITGYKTGPTMADLIGLLYAEITSGATYLMWGGGSSTFYAPTHQRWYVAANATTTTGTKVLELTTSALASSVPFSAPNFLAPTKQIFTSSGTWTKPTGCRLIKVTVIGAGGAGGGATGAGSQASFGQGGGAGGYSIKYIDATSLTTETVTIGSGGTGVSAGTGTNGGSSSFGSHCSATGGTGGARQATGTSVLMAGAQNSGVGSSGDINGGGFTPTPGFRSSGTVSVSSGGASSILGGGVGGRSSNGNGFNAVANTGAGGAGANSTDGTDYTGGNGADGIVIVEEFY